MSYCYLCNKKLCNEKPEHIIPNALGGHLKCNDILCSDCNNKLSDIDRKLCSDLELLTNFISPKRECNKTKIPIVETVCDGEIFIRSADGSYRKKQNVINYDGKTLHMSFSHTPNSVSEKKDFQVLQDILRQFAKKHNKTEDWVQKQINQALTQAVVNSRDSGIHHFQFVANKSRYSFLGVLKIVLGFCSYYKIDKKYLSHAVQLLKTKDIKSCQLISNYFNDNSKLPKNSVFHTIYLKGDNRDKLLYAIVSLYGVFNVFVLLSKEYDGNNIEETYCYDVMKNCKIAHSMSYYFDAETIKNILTETMDVSIATDNFNQFIKYFMLKDRQNYLLKKIEEIKQSVFQRLVFRNENLTEEIYRQDFTALFCDNIKKCPNIEFLPEECFYDFSKIILDHMYTFTWYCYNKEMLLLIGNSVSIIWNSRPKTPNELFNCLTAYMNSYTCKTPEIQQLYDKNKKGLINFVLNIYKNYLENEYYKTFLLNQNTSI